MLSATLRSLYNVKAPFDQASPAGLGSDLHRTRNIVKAQYNFAVQGGAIGTIAIPDDFGNAIVIPSAAIIMRTYVDFNVACAGATATVAFTSGEAAGDILAATAVASCTGLVEGTATNAIATAKKMTAARGVSIVIATANLTAGAANVFVEYVLSN